MIRENDMLVLPRMRHFLILIRPAVAAGILGNLAFVLQEDEGLRGDAGAPTLARFLLRSSCAHRCGLARTTSALLACHGCWVEETRRQVREEEEGVNGEERNLYP